LLTLTQLPSVGETDKYKDESETRADHFLSAGNKSAYYQLKNEPSEIRNLENVKNALGILMNQRITSRFPGREYIARHTL
jgi:hypothetical protein